MKQLLILAGGKGTRLGSRLGELPKPMMEVEGKPLLQHQLELGRRHGFTQAVLFVGYRAEVIEARFGDGAALGMEIRYAREDEPLGSAGAVLTRPDLLAEQFLVMYGDTMMDVDLGRFWAHHQEAGAEISLFLHPNDHPHDSDLVEVDEEGRVLAFHPYPHPPDRFLPNLVNAALYVMERRALEGAGPARKADFAKDVFPQLLRQGVRFHGYRSPEYIKDMGTPERYDRVVADYRSGKIASRSLSTPQPAVFLDRDGTLNRYAGFVRRLDELELVEDVGAALKRLNRSRYRTAVITNQPVIARGDCTWEELRQIHAKLETLLGREGAYVDRIYVCPHHPDRGFPGERPELKLDCACRKPKTGLIERAVRELAIDLAGSWLIGDTSTDVRTARNAKVRSILLRTGQAGTDGKFPDRPDYVFHALADAVDFVLSGHSALRERLLPLSRELRPGQWVGLGGLAHSGKSTLATVLRELLQEQGQAAAVISLDGWIRSGDQRAGKGLEAGFDYAALEQAVRTLRAGEAVVVPWYERASRKRRDDGERLQLPPGAVVIVEGVVALEAPAVVAALDRKLYVDCDEAERRRRFIRDYRWRGQDEAFAEALYAEREVSEHPLVRAGRARADLILEGVR